MSDKILEYAHYYGYTGRLGMFNAIISDMHSDILKLFVGLGPDKIITSSILQEKSKYYYLLSATDMIRFFGSLGLIGIFIITIF